MDKIEVKRATLRPPATLEFKPVRPLLDRPLEISRAQLRGLAMVDETIIVRQPLKPRGDR